jgi:hypothetical protein
MSRGDSHEASVPFLRSDDVGALRGFGRGLADYRDGLRVLNAPGCTGGVVGTYQYQGSGASNGGYQYSEAERLQLFDRATTAATQGTRISLYVESVGGGIFTTTYSAN